MVAVKLNRMDNDGTCDDVRADGLDHYGYKIIFKKDDEGEMNTTLTLFAD